MRRPSLLPRLVIIILSLALAVLASSQVYLNARMLPYGEILLKSLSPTICRLELGLYSFTVVGCLFIIGLTISLLKRKGGNEPK